MTNGPGEYILAFAGTEDLADIRTDIEQALGRQTAAYTVAALISKGLKQAMPESSHITVTGHSLGGGLATAAAIIGGYSAITFNSAGISKERIYEQHRDDNYPNMLTRWDRQHEFITDYINRHDLLNKAQEELSLPAPRGSRVILNGPYDTKIDGLNDEIQEAMARDGNSPFSTLFDLEREKLVYELKTHLTDAYFFGLMQRLSPSTDVYGKIF